MKVTVHCFRVLVVLLFHAYLLQFASAATLTVNPGDSIQNAIDRAANGDTVMISPGTYKERLYIYKEISLLGEDSANTILDATGVQFYSVGGNRYFDNRNVLLFNGDMISGTIARLTLKDESDDPGNQTLITSVSDEPYKSKNQNITIDQNILIGGRLSTIHLNGNCNYIITNNVIVSHGGGGIGWSSGADEFGVTPVIGNNIITGCKTFKAIHFDGGKPSPYIFNNLIHHNPNPSGAVYFGSGCSPTAKIVNNTFDSNGNGIWSWGELSGLIQNNIVSNNANSGIFCGSGPTAVVSNNNLWNNGGWGNYSGITHGKNDISINPRFRDPDLGDYHLAPFSRCIDWGTAANAPVYDIEGRDRPKGKAFDIGAYESEFERKVSQPWMLLLED